MKIHGLSAIEKPAKRAGFTLVEVVIASAIAALSLAAMMYGYAISARRTEWAGYSLAAQALAMQRVEQARSAQWDPFGSPPIDELVTTNFPPLIVPLDIPTSGTNIVLATNVTTITDLSTDPPLKMIQVDCSWSFAQRGSFTNSVITYRSAF
jgi:prepilin-type N-terminal cleavage/methylation domain-containing protein